MLPWMGATTDPARSVDGARERILDTAYELFSRAASATSASTR